MVTVAAREGLWEKSASKLELVRNSVLATELKDDQCAILARLTSVRDLADGEIWSSRGRATAASTLS